MIEFPGENIFGTTKMKLLLVSLMSLLACCPSLAAQNERFVEFPYGLDQTLTYDLRTVQMIQPGRFTIVSTVMDNADFMRFELKVLYILRTYCKGPDGKYQPPTDVFTLGPPDLPIESIEVKSGGLKIARWRYPYKRLAIKERGGEYAQMYTSLICKEFVEARARITNGERRGGLFDCKRGLVDIGGVPLFGDEEPSREYIRKTMDPRPFEPDTNGETIYRAICHGVTHETPYSPQ
jgi:hypothetical protein